MKKFLSMTMTLIMLMALAVPAFAVNKESDSNSEAEVQEEILESASEFAYLDADKATPDVALQTSCEKFSYNLQKRNGA